MGQARDAIENLKALVPNAVANGTLSRQAADAFWNIVGGRGGAAAPAAPVAPVDRGVTINLRVSGRNGALPVQANAEVERVLAQLAGTAGLTVTRGSVRITS